MYTLQAPSFLQNMDKIPLDMTLEGMDAYDQIKAADALGLANSQRQYGYDQKADPLRLAQLGLQNQTSEAQLPGLKALSEHQQLQTKKMRETNDADIAALLAKHGYEKTKSWLDSYANAGTISRDAAAAIWANPMGGRVIAKQMFERAGHPELWNPQWDNMAPDRLAMSLDSFGKEIQTNSEKYGMTMDKAQLQGDLAARVKAMQMESAERQTQWRLENARSMKIAELDYKAKHFAPGLQQLASQYRAFAVQAREDGKSVESMKWEQEAARLMEEASRIPTGSAQVAAEGKVDIRGVTQGAVPTVSPNRTAGQPIATPPPGTAPTTNKTIKVRHPDGRTGTIPANELQQALKEGYIEIK